MAASAVSSATQFDKALEDHMRALCEPPKGSSKGVFYPLSYFRALGEQPRTDWLRNRSAFYNGHASIKHWELATLANDVKMGPTNHDQFFFVLKAGVKPCEALDVLKEGPTLLDCVAVAQVAMYLALRDRLGNEKFDAVFERSGPTPLALDRFGSGSSFWVEETKELGQVRFLMGDPDYPIRHPSGSSGGLATVVVGEKRLAFGLGECTESEALQYLTDEHNRPGSTAWLEDPHTAWPYLTIKDAIESMTVLLSAFVAKHEDLYTRAEWTPERKAQATFVEIERITTGASKIGVGALERLNRTASSVRIKENCLQELEDAELDRVGDVVQRWLPSAPCLNRVDYSLSPPQVTLTSDGAVH